jgi:hypothetical protein
MDNYNVFFAYPSRPLEIGQAVAAATERLHKYQTRIRVRPWEQKDMAGAFIADKILDEIAHSNAVCADITRLNFNVTYEVGYAIGAGKAIRPVRNKSFKSEPIALEALGIYDTIGYESYENAEQLAEKIRGLPSAEPLPIARPINSSAPVYLNQSKTRTDHQNEIISRVKKANLHFRSFDPGETPRLSAREAIRHVSESLGVLLHFVPDEYADAELHNLRAAFLAGLAHGMRKETVLIQFGDSPVPLDYRELVVYCRNPDDYKEHIGRFASAVYELMQASKPSLIREDFSFLSALDLGASTAENELTHLDEYYLETTAHRRAVRGEVRLVTGRKGSGKTAIFFRVRDSIRRSKANVVLDLRPEGYQLRKFKDAVLTRLQGGTAEHVITAFWEYVLLLEIARALVANDYKVSKFDHRLFEPYQRLLVILHRASEEGDFAERLTRLLHDVQQTYEAKYGEASGVTMLQPEISALIYRHDIHELRAQVFEYLAFKEQLWLLFDNIDKGWPTSGLTTEDLIILRTLLEATRKIEREANRRQIEAHSLVFLRNDVYELLLRATPDRGKETRVNVDWTDRELLCELLRKRIAKNSPDLQEKSFGEVWKHIAQPIVEGEDSAQFVLDRSLMRPRSLIDLVNHCLGVATTLRHTKITDDDIRKGVQTYSTDLITDISFEMSDVFPGANDVPYAFIGAKHEFSPAELAAMLVSVNVPADRVTEVRTVLFWFAFLGVRWPSPGVKYIYDVNYDMKMFLGAHDKFSEEELRYQVNPAFWAGLGIGPGI